MYKMMAKELAEISDRNLEIEANKAVGRIMSKLWDDLRTIAERGLYQYTYACESKIKPKLESKLRKELEGSGLNIKYCDEGIKFSW